MFFFMSTFHTCVRVCIGISTGDSYVVWIERDVMIISHDIKLYSTVVESFLNQNRAKTGLFTTLRENLKTNK